MDMGTFKALELLLIVGVVGYFFLRQRRSLQQLKEEREAKQARTDEASGTDPDDTTNASN
jgi:hypothetical protein